MKSEDPKRKIIQDRTFPGPDQIRKYQDFDRVYSDYSVVKKLLLKKTVFWTGAAVTLAAVSGVVVMNISSGPEKNISSMDREPEKSVPAVNPPIPAEDIPYAVYRISSAKGGVLHYPTGSSINIPPGAFLHADGTRVSDSVDIKYREFHTPLDIFLSGIPMNYDSGGVVRTFESAGMLEIQASDQGKNLLLSSAKPIDVKMASLNSDDRFNLYELDTAKKNWIYRGKDKIERVVTPKPVRRSGSLSKQGPPQETTVKPVLADPQKFRFSITYAKKDYPELAAYDNVVFEVTDENFKPSFYSIDWEKITLHCGETYGHYIIKLSKADTTICFTAMPVFEKENYEAALKQFEQKHNVTSQAMDTRELETQKKVDQVNKELSTYNSRVLVAAAFDNAGISVTFRNFSVRALGFHNMDIPLAPVQAYALKILGNYQNRQSGLASAGIPFNDIYLVQKGKNAVFRFSRGEPVKCDPKARNLMWTVTNTSQIAFFRINDYSKLINGEVNRIEPVVAPSQDLAFREIREFSQN